MVKTINCGGATLVYGFHISIECAKGLHFSAFHYQHEGSVNLIINLILKFGFIVGVKRSEGQCGTGTRDCPIAS